MDLDFYDEQGIPVAYSDDEEHIYLFDGEPVAYFDDDAVFAFDGRHIGWFDDGWMRDKAGRCILFTPDASGGPIRPVRQVKPVKGVKHVRPVKGVRQVRSLRAINSLSWSDFAFDELF